MKLATFTFNDVTEIGFIQDSSVMPLRLIEQSMPTNMISLIKNWQNFGNQLKKITYAKDNFVNLKDVKLHSPVIDPKKIFGHGLNYADHILEIGVNKPKNQLWFSKHINTLNGPYDFVELPKASSETDYEVELVVVIGEGGRNISNKDALKHVFGYCVGNDVSVRDWQMRTSQWTLGKSFDTHGPVGPFITTADEVGDPHRLRIRSFVNGELRQDSNTSQLIFKVPDLISYLSRAVTLEPGDLIFTGTPGGVGFMMKPPQFLKDGDVVKCEIDELGSIQNTFKSE